MYPYEFSYSAYCLHEDKALHIEIRISPTPQNKSKTDAN